MNDWQEHARLVLCEAFGVDYPTSEIEDFLVFHWQSEASDEENINNFLEYV